MIIGSLAVRVAAAEKQPAFDHSGCQYPDRSTNPPNGCDNSDPCDPANAAKGGSGMCSDAMCPGKDPIGCLDEDDRAEYLEQEAVAPAPVAEPEFVTFEGK